MKNPCVSQGYIVSGIVLLLLGGSIFYLTALEQQLSHLRVSMRHEQHYFIAYNQALSALSWGITYPWSQNIGLGWHCRSPRVGLFQACIKKQQGKDVLLLQGRSQQQVGQQPIRLYQHVRLHKKGVGIFPVTHGWIDFCPLPRDEQCD